MAIDLLGERGEIVGSRITVYNLIPYFLDPAITESEICRSYGLTTQQVAAARALVFSDPVTYLARHFEIEARNAAGNPPEVVAQFKRSRARLAEFKEWMEARSVASSKNITPPSSFPTFREWLTERESHAQERA